MSDKLINKAWSTQVQEQEKIAELTVSLKESGNNHPKKIVVTFNFGKAGMTFPFRWEETSFTLSLSELLSLAEENTLTAIENAYKGSNQKLSETIDFLKRCFREVELELDRSYK